MIAAFQESTAKRKIRTERVAIKTASQEKRTSVKKRIKAKIRRKRIKKSRSEPPA